MKPIHLLLPVVLFAAACTKKTDTLQPANGGAPQAAAPAEDDHGPAIPLGKLTVGAHTFEVVQRGAVEAGKEGVVELHFPADKPVASGVRAWFGIASGEGSMKGKFGKEGDHGLHAHLEVPKTLPAGSQVWIEIEADGKVERGALNWK